MIKSSTGDFCWSPDGALAVLGVGATGTGAPAKVFRRAVAGTEDVLVYAEPDPGFFVHVGVTQSRAFLVIGSGDHETSEVSLISAAEPTAAPRVIEPRTPGLRYSVEHWPTDSEADRLVVLTNADGAVDYQIMWADASTPGRAGWRPWIAHEPGRYITGMAVLRDHLVRGERVDANDRIVVTARDTLAEHAIAFDEDAYALSFSTGYEWATDTITFVYQSAHHPAVVVRLRPAHAHADLAQGAGGALRPRPGPLCRAQAARDGRGTGRPCRSPC